MMLAPHSMTLVIDEKTFVRLKAAAHDRFGPPSGEAEHMRQIEELAEAAVSEAALNYFRGRHDPGAST